MFKKYRLVLPVSLLAISMICLTITSIPRWVSLLLMALASILMLVASRGSYYFTKAGKILTQRKPGYIEKAIALYEKADKFGVPMQYSLIIGTIFLQYGDIEKGRKDLEQVLKSKDNKLVFQAKESLSMYYWIKRDLDKAIELCESARDMGMKNQNLYINLGTYYLKKGRTKDFKILQREAYKANMDSIALIDLQAEYLILTNDYRRSGNFLKSIFDKTTLTFQDPYIHFALVYLYYGKTDIAIKYLNECLENATFSNVALYSREDIEKMISLLESDDTKWAFATEAVKNPKSFLSGKMPECSERVEEPKFEPLVEFKSESLGKNDIANGSDDEPDTTLTEEDEEWIKRHQD